MWTWILGVFGKLGSKLGLVLGYIAIGVSVVLGCAAVWFYHQNQGLHDSVSALTTKAQHLDDQAGELRGSLKEQKQALSDLMELRKKDAQVMSGLADAVGGITKDARQQRSMIQQLKERSDEVRSYLRTPLPASVRVVLSGKAAPAAGASVPATGGQGDQAPAGAASVQGNQDQGR